MTPSTARPSYTVLELATRVSGDLRGSGDPRIVGLNTVHEAGPGELTFVGSELHARAWTAGRASAAVVTQSLAEQALPTADRSVILVPDADVAMIAMLELFAPEEERAVPGVDPSASIDPSATIGRDVRIGPHVSIGRGAVIGDRVSLHAGVRVYPEASIGEDSNLHANAVVRERCTIGRRVILHGGVQIGSDGFGYRPAPGGRGILKVPHLGHVEIEDDVEIGANSCVDRGKFGATLIGAGTKIDNLVQIGHNCRIGRCCLISGLVGIAGSTVLGDGVLVGGGSGLSDHLKIGRGVRIAARSAVMNDIPDGETWGGYPAKELRRAMQEAIVASKLPEYLKNLKHLLGAEAARTLERGPDKPAERAMGDRRG